MDPYRYMITAEMCKAIQRISLELMKRILLFIPQHSDNVRIMTTFYSTHISAVHYGKNSSVVVVSKICAFS